MRLIRAAGLAAIIAATCATVASAKMPQFDVEITPLDPTAGESILIAVRMWPDSDPSLTAWAPTIDDLLVIRAADGAAPEIPVILQLREPSRYEAEVTLAAGAWALVAFPDRTGWATPEVPAGYPDTIPLTVRERGLDLAPVGIPVAAVALLVGAVYSRNRLRSAALTRSSSVDETPTSASAARDASRASPIE